MLMCATKYDDEDILPLVPQVMTTLLFLIKLDILQLNM